MNLDNKKIVITGASSGIGEAILKELAKFDVEIIATGTSLINIKTVLEKINGPAKIIPFACDFKQKDSIDKLFNFALEKMNEINLFISNAGFGYIEKIEEANWDHIEDIYRVNTITSIYATLKMRDLNKEKPYMTIITASAIAHMSIAGYALYGGTKAALERFAESYRFEMPKNATLSLIYPIATKTKFFENAANNSPVPSVAQTPKQVADSVIKGIKNNSESIYPSNTFRVFIFLNKFFPFMSNIYKKIEYNKFINWLKNK